MFCLYPASPLKQPFGRLSSSCHQLLKLPYINVYITFPASETCIRGSPWSTNFSDKQTVGHFVKKFPNFDEPEGSLTLSLATDFSWFPCVYKPMLRWFPSFQVATTCFSCSPPDLNFLVTFFHICVHVK